LEFSSNSDAANSGIEPAPAVDLLWRLVGEQPAGIALQKRVG
jgi:hypothetical protein